VLRRLILLPNGAHQGQKAQSSCGGCAPWYRGAGLTNSVNFIEIQRIRFHRILKTVILLFLDLKYLKNM
jgi:hypothetical protein